MAEIKWTDHALKNISDIADYISLDSVHYAELFVRNIFEKTLILESFHLSGRIVPEFSSIHLRELIYGTYRIVYKLYDNHLDIIAVHHSSRILSNKSLFEN